MKRLLLAGLCLLLAACAARTPVPERPPRLDLPQSLQVQRQAQGETRDWLLVVQAEGPALRWSLFDPLGCPCRARCWRTAPGATTACCRPTTRPANFAALLCPGPGRGIAAGLRRYRATHRHRWPARAGRTLEHRLPRAAGLRPAAPRRPALPNHRSRRGTPMIANLNALPGLRPGPGQAGGGRRVVRRRRIGMRRQAAGSRDAN